LARSLSPLATRACRIRVMPYGAQSQHVPTATERGARRHAPRHPAPASPLDSLPAVGRRL